jgi:DNA-binding NtrC family response regulator
MKKFRAIIIDDERNVREVLELLLLRYCPEVEVAGLASSAAEGRKHQRIRCRYYFSGYFHA